MSKIGTADIKGIMLGSTEISKAYLGSDVVFEKENKYIELNAVVFGKAVSVTLDIAPNANNWFFEGAVARHNNITTSSHTGLFRFIAQKSFNVNNNLFAFNLYPNDTFNVSIFTKYSAKNAFTIPSTIDSKIVFSAKTGEATVNGTTQSVARAGGTAASNRTLIIGDYYLKQMEVVFWYFRASQNGVLLRNYVPAQRIEDEVIGIWDKVTDTFLLPSGGNLVEYTSS